MDEHDANPWTSNDPVERQQILRVHIGAFQDSLSTGRKREELILEVELIAEMGQLLVESVNKFLENLPTSDRFHQILHFQNEQMESIQLVQDFFKIQLELEELPDIVNHLAQMAESLFIRLNESVDAIPVKDSASVMLKEQQCDLSESTSAEDKVSALVTLKEQQCDLSESTSADGKDSAPVTLKEQQCELSRSTSAEDIDRDANARVSETSPVAHQSSELQRIPRARGRRAREKVINYSGVPYAYNK